MDVSQGNLDPLTFKLPGNWDTEKYSVTNIFQATMAILELAILEPRAQILGGIGFFDMQNLTLQQAYHMTPTVAHKIVQILVVSLITFFSLELKLIHHILGWEVIILQPVLIGHLINHQCIKTSVS